MEECDSGAMGKWLSPAARGEGRTSSALVAVGFARLCGVVKDTFPEKEFGNKFHSPFLIREVSKVPTFSELVERSA
jgi:hypothetical protein